MWTTQAPHASHVTPHHHASKRTLEYETLISSQVSKSKRLPLMTMPPSAWAASLISDTSAALHASRQLLNALRRRAAVRRALKVRTRLNS